MEDELHENHGVTDSLLPSYGAEAVIPMELIYGSPRVLAYDEVVQEQHRRDDAVILEENRLWAATCVTCYEQRHASLSQPQGSC